MLRRNERKLLYGLGWDQKLLQRMAKVSNGIPVTTTSTASVRALKTFNVHRIVFAGPYIEEVTERGRLFFEANGYKVLNAVGLGLDTDLKIGRVSLEDVYHLAKQADRPDAKRFSSVVQGCGRSEYWIAWSTTSANRLCRPIRHRLRT